MSTEIQAQTTTETQTDTTTQQELESTSSGGMGGAGNELSDIADLLGLSEAGTSEEGQEKKDETKTGEETPPAKTQAKPDDGKGEQKTAPAPVPGEEEKAGEEAKKLAEPSLKDVLKEVLAETRAEIPKQEEKPAEEKKAEEPFYKPMVPVEIMQGMESEDPEVRRHAVSAMIGGAMNKVRNDLMTTLRAEFAQALSQMPALIDTRQQQKDAAEAFRTSFYEDNPNFGTSPKRQQLVAYVAMDLAKRQIADKTYKGTTPEFRAKLAEEVEQMTGIKAGKTAQPEKKETIPAKKQFQSGGSNTRTSEVSQSLSQEILDVVGVLPN